MSEPSLPKRDDPVERIAGLLAADGWDVERRDGRIVEYQATKDGWTIVVRPACFGLRAELTIQRPDGVWIMAALSGDEYASTLRLLDIEPRDLWRRDLIEGLSEAA